MSDPAQAVTAPTQTAVVAPARPPLNNMTRTKKIRHTKKELLDAIAKSNGTITSVLRILKHEVAHSIVMGWFEEYPEVLDFFRMKQQELTDRAEDVLLANLEKPGKRQLKTAMFILRTVPNARFNPALTEEGMAQNMAHFMALVQHALTPADPEPINISSVDADDSTDDDEDGGED